MKCRLIYSKEQINKLKATNYDNKGSE